MLPAAVTKMHGTRNDFILIDARQSDPGDLTETARFLCDRRAGVGADGVLVIHPSSRADVRVQIINADGTEAEMCGNGMRCVARFLSEAGEGETKRIEAAGGIVQTEVLDRGEPYMVRVDMGIPQFEAHAIPYPDATFVRVGNPHIVLFQRSIESVDLISVAQRLQQVFPDGINVHIAVGVDDHSIDVRHWERGVGITYACGSGAVACAAAAIKNGLARSPVDVHVPGGVLRVEWEGSNAHLTGPAVRVFDAA